MRTAITRRYSVSAVERTFQIIEELAEEDRGLTLSQITERLRLPKSTVFGILVTLEGLRYVEHDPDTDRYRLGLRLYSVAARMVERSNLVQLSMPVLRSLVEELGETANLGILRDGQVVYALSIEGRGPLKVAVSPGSTSRAHCTALGKVLLAALPPEEARCILNTVGMPRFTPRTVTDPDTLLAELERVRQLGYAVDNEEENVGVRCLAAPVRNAKGQVTAAISITGPCHRLPDEKLSELARVVQGAARSLSERLGHLER